MQQDFERYADEIKDGLKEDGPEFEPFVPFESEERTPLPSFPVDALPSELRNYVSAVAESLQVPVDMPAVVGLSVIALCVQGSFVINPIQGAVRSVYCNCSASVRKKKPGDGGNDISGI